MTLKQVFNIISYIFIFGLLISCRKSDFLDIRPDYSKMEISSPKDLQALLDNAGIMNGDGLSGANPGLGVAASDEYYNKNGFGTTEYADSYFKLYTWQDGFTTQSTPYYDWDFAYNIIFVANVVLDNIGRFNSPNYPISQINNIKGAACFFRAEMLFCLAQIYCPPYDAATADTDWGLVLKLSSDINEAISRSKNSDTYKQILSDLEQSITLLPDLPLEGLVNRPSKAAAYALLARVYLSMREYEKVLLYADKSLSIYSELLDYTQINPSSGRPIPRYNKETVFYSELIDLNTGTLTTHPSNAIIDSTVYNAYDINDIRGQAFFNSRKGFKGSYTGSIRLFGGIATDEVYLMRAEGYARKGDLIHAMEDLNTLLRHRYKKDNDGNTLYLDQNATDINDAVKKIILERRKELVFRGTRWIDLRRLNKEGWEIGIKRIVNGVEYYLAPNDLRYTFLIPPQIIQFNPNMPQNIR